MPEIRFVHVPTAVEVRFDEEGHLRPTSFTWQGLVEPIADVGRHWVEEEEGRPIYHVLVMTSGQEVFELCFDPQNLRWQVRQMSERRVVA
jgi:hypothetical protein